MVSEDVFICPGEDEGEKPVTLTVVEVSRRSVVQADVSGADVIAFRGNAGSDAAGALPVPVPKNQRVSPVCRCRRDRRPEIVSVVSSSGTACACRTGAGRAVSSNTAVKVIFCIDNTLKTSLVRDDLFPCRYRAPQARFTTGRSCSRGDLLLREEDATRKWPSHPVAR